MELLTQHGPVVALIIVGAAGALVAARAQKRRVAYGPHICQFEEVRHPLDGRVWRRCKLCGACTRT